MDRTLRRLTRSMNTRKEEETRTAAEEMQTKPTRMWTRGTIRALRENKALTKLASSSYVPVFRALLPQCLKMGKESEE
ncbi:hypothetical protein NDU88_003368 [Pleurodeles waltl]|uniref:Uncharacterized protein n=1 Tax=Pleurodeles waltl TaxID=8319 RepID=A0AAV7M6U9_PLEWA|nr:hypothetical protein NDU88_003368 [Pleurodeles waltl]